jgi:hypothetical protein
MTDKDPFEFPPAGRVRFLDVPELDHTVTGKEAPLTTRWHKFQEALALHPLPKVFHITCAIPAIGSPAPVQLRIGAAYKLMVEQLMAVTYEDGFWSARTLNSTFIQRWGAPPTSRQLRIARRLMYAQKRLTDQLAEIQDARVPESNGSRLA